MLVHHQPLPHKILINGLNFCIHTLEWLIHCLKIIGLKSTPLTIPPIQGDNSTVGFNNATSREKLKPSRQIAAKCNLLNCLAVFYLHSLCFTFFWLMADKGKVGLCPLVIVWPASHPLPFVCRPPRENGKRLIAKQKRYSIWTLLLNP